MLVSRRGSVALPYVGDWVAAATSQRRPPPTELDGSHRAVPVQWLLGREYYGGGLRKARQESCRPTMFLPRPRITARRRRGSGGIGRSSCRAAPPAGVGSPSARTR